jgi:hypothetical protein
MTVIYIAHIEAYIMSRLVAHYISHKIDYYYQKDSPLYGSHSSLYYDQNLIPLYGSHSSLYLTSVIALSLANTVASIIPRMIAHYIPHKADCYDSNNVPRLI